MLGKTHLGIGLLAGAISPFVGLAGPDIFFSWGALALGSLAPDLDGQGYITKPSMWVPEVIPVPPIVDRIGGAFGRMIAEIFGHRGALHYPLIVVIMVVVAMYWQNNVLLWFSVGYASHLLADSVTKMGIPMLGPLWSKRFGIGPRSMRLITGSKLESFITIAVWASFWGLLLLQLAGFSSFLPVNQNAHTVFLPIIFH